MAKKAILLQHKESLFHKESKIKIHNRKISNYCKFKQRHFVTCTTESSNNSNIIVSIQQ